MTPQESAKKSAKKINPRPDDSASVQEALAAIDWNFTERGMPHAVEAIHPYPAKFIGELPRTLMQILPCPEGSCVLDPFAGSGTTLVEAQRLGIPSVGIDINPIACLIAQVKTGPTPKNVVDVALKVAESAYQCHEKKPLDIPNVDHWFKPDVQAAVTALLDELRKIGDPVVRTALRLSLSSILVRVSNQESDTRYAAVEKNIDGNQVFTLFTTAANKLGKALLARNWHLTPTRVIEADTLSLKPENIKLPVGLVVTSPPYPNAYEYWLYHKYRMWWLGFDPLAVKEKEIGARAHFFKRNGHTEESFYAQMKATFSLISSSLVDGGYACFVIGRSKIHGKIIDNADIILTVAAECGFSAEAKFQRTLSATRKSFNLSHANIKTETIVVIRKQKND